MTIGPELFGAFGATVIFNAGAFWGVALFYRRVANGRMKRDEEDLREFKATTGTDVREIKEGVGDIRERLATIEEHCRTMDCLKGTRVPERNVP
jgi:hypothetical protein